MLDLIKFFDSINDQDYCVIKMSPSLPEFSPGQDIDIFCFDPQQISQKILEWGNEYLKNGLAVRTKLDKDHNHIQIDFMKQNEIYLRFDLYGRLPNYTKLLLKPALFESIIERSGIISRNAGGRTFSVKTPSDIDELILRYIEFVEWYNTRPDKIKHLDYIMQKIDEDKKTKFLDRLHHYTALPPYPDRNELQENSLGGLVRRFYLKLRNRSL